VGPVVLSVVEVMDSVGPDLTLLSGNCGSSVEWVTFVELQLLLSGRCGRKESILETRSPCGVS